MKIGDKLPPFRFLALKDGALWHIASEQFSGAWTCWSFLPGPSGYYTGSMDEDWQQLCSGSADLQLLLVLPARAFPFQLGWGPMSCSIVVDPLGGLHRRFGLSNQSKMECWSFLIDPDGFIRFQLVHEPTEAGMRAMGEILKESRRRPAVQNQEAGLWR